MIKNILKTMRYVVYVVLIAGTAWVSSMAYSQVSAMHAEKTRDLSTWLSKNRITRLMRFHGTDILKVTPDEVFIPRGSKWVSVMKRDGG